MESPAGARQEGIVPGRRGFSLVELVLALVLLQVGLLGTVGMLLLSQRYTTRARLIQRHVLEADRLADSLVREGSGEAGTMEFRWGTLGWTPVGGSGEGFRVWGLGPRGRDTLVVLRVPSRPPGFPGVRGDG